MTARLHVTVECTCVIVMCMPRRIHLIIDDRENDAFRARAAAVGLSLSEWLRQAARERLERERPARITTVDDLDRFFAVRRESESGVEPDWDEHLRVIDQSRRGALEPR